MFRHSVQRDGLLAQKSIFCAADINTCVLTTWCDCEQPLCVCMYMPFTCSAVCVLLHGLVHDVTGQVNCHLVMHIHVPDMCVVCVVLGVVWHPLVRLREILQSQLRWHPRYVPVHTRWLGLCCLVPMQCAWLCVSVSGLRCTPCIWLHNLLRWLLPDNTPAACLHA